MMITETKRQASTTTSYAHGGLNIVATTVVGAPETVVTAIVRADVDSIPFGLHERQEWLTEAMRRHGVILDLDEPTYLGTGETIREDHHWTVQAEMLLP